LIPAFSAKLLRRTALMIPCIVFLSKSTVWYLNIIHYNFKFDKTHKNPVLI
jgi:hypothetical protein